MANRHGPEAERYDPQVRYTRIHTTALANMLSLTSFWLLRWRRTVYAAA